MVITKEVSVLSIADAGDVFGGCLLHITAKMVVKRDDIEIINREFTAKYKVVPELTVDQRLVLWAKDIKAQMQDAINDYDREQKMLTNPKLATTATWIQTNLNVTSLV